MTDQIDESNSDHLSKEEWRRVARFDDSSIELTERENRLAAEALAPVISRVAEMMSSIVPDFSPAAREAAQEVLRRLAEISTVVRTFTESAAPYLQEIFESLGYFDKRKFPENWDGVDGSSFKGLDSILIDEGIPLMWVPGAVTVEALLTAGSASDRRRIIGSRWKRIASDCEVVLHEIDHPKLLSERDFALDCVAALRDGHTNPAQSLAANLLDTVLGHLDKSTRTQRTKNSFKQNGEKFDLDEHEFRAAFTFAPVWCAHATFWVDKGDSVPRTFGRHPSVHAVSRAQYSRINAIIGLMVVTSVLKFFDTQMLR
ncbi:hypothetical protein OG407_23980 [Streptomyces sp. NBC_01515]|uniref:hypothetical protein n=1 Tax=Streptomyces sp. NBC_01515 TaxID=2903890 RepID=UPI0038659886